MFNFQAGASNGPLTQGFVISIFSLGESCVNDPRQTFGPRLTFTV